MRYHSNHLQRFSETQADPLTGVGNRRALEGVVEAQFGLLRRYGTPFSLAVVDIDRFKDLNDATGALARRRGVAEPGGAARWHGAARSISWPATAATSSS